MGGLLLGRARESWGRRIGGRALDLSGGMFPTAGPHVGRGAACLRGFSLDDSTGPRFWFRGALTPGALSLIVGFALMIGQVGDPRA